MHISTDARKNMRKFLSFSNPNASSPSVSTTLTFLDLSADGGVFGSVKLKIPKMLKQYLPSKMCFSAFLPVWIPENPRRKYN